MANVLNWILGVLTLLLGIVFMIIDPLLGLVFIAISLLLLPPVRSFAFNKSNITLNSKVRAALISGLLIVGLAMLAKYGQSVQKAEAEHQAKAEVEKIEAIKQRTIQEFKTNKATILAELKTLMDSKSYQQVIDTSSKYLVSADTDLMALQTQARAELDKIKKAQAIRSVWDEINKVKIEPANFGKLKELYQKLANLEPENIQHTESVDYYVKQVKAVEDAKKKAVQQTIRDEQRKKLIETQFSHWNGSHKALERLIKKNMNDPSSYEHVETKYIDRNDHLFVITTFRGKNAFGALVLNTIKAKVDLSGNVLEVIR